MNILQVSADGAGPYICNMDFSSNADGTSGQTNLTVAENDSGSGNITLTVTMPTDMACFGGKCTISLESCEEELTLNLASTRNV